MSIPYLKLLPTCDFGLAMALAKDGLSLTCATKAWTKRLWDLVRVLPLFALWNVVWRVVVCCCYLWALSWALEVGMAKSTLEVGWAGELLKGGDLSMYIGDLGAKSCIWFWSCGFGTIGGWGSIGGRVIIGRICSFT